MLLTRTLWPLGLFLLAACGNQPEDTEDVALTADEFAALAVPGVDESALDRTVDPCSDFFEFACGTYNRTVPATLEHDEESFGVEHRESRAFVLLMKDRKRILDQLLVDIAAAPRSEAERKASAFYRSCVREPDPTKTSPVIAEQRDQIAAVRTPEELATVLGRLHRRNVEALFGVSPTTDPAVGRRRETVLAYAGGFDGGIDYHDASARAFRVDQLREPITVVAPSISEEDAARMAETAVAIEERLSAAASKGEGPREHPVGREGLARAAPRFAWDAYFAALGRTQFDDFPVAGLEYFAALDEIVATADPAELRTYLTVTWYRMAWAYQMSGSGSRRAYRCEGKLAEYMSEAIEPRFLELAGIDAKARAKAKALWKAIVTTFESELENEEFLDVETRIEAEHKLQKVSLAFVASRTPDSFSDVDIAADEDFVAIRLRLLERSFARDLAQFGHAFALGNPASAAPFVTAEYAGQVNRVSVPGGILGGYFFSPGASAMANFAGIGAVLGHELTHGFDDQGRMTDGDGVFRSWWTSATASAFQARAQGLVEQYSAFTLDGVPNFDTGVVPAHVDGAMTLTENIADNGGIKTAFRASKVATMTEPVVAGFTPAQQFFVGYAQLWCGQLPPDEASLLLTWEAHSPAKARVNLPLKNFDAFGTAFQCKTGTPMAPAERRGVW